MNLLAVRVSYLSGATAARIVTYSGRFIVSSGDERAVLQRTPRGEASIQRRCVRGFSLLELVVVLALVLVVMAIVLLVLRAGSLLYHTERQRAERGATGLRAIDDIAVEISQAGFGLGHGLAPLIPGLPGERPSSASVTIRSNPEGVATTLLGDLIQSERPARVEDARLFQPGDRVLLADARGHVERAEISRSERGYLAVRSLDGPRGQLRRRFSASTRLVKVREVQYSLRTAESTGRVVLVKRVDGRPEQVLAHHVGELRFEYQDDAGNKVALARVGGARSLALVRATLRLLPIPEPLSAPFTVPPLSRTVALGSHSAAVSFDVPARAFRLRQVFYRMDNAVAVAARPFFDAGVILLSGAPRWTGPGLLYSFVAQRVPGDVRVDTVLPLPPVREAVAASFGPQDGPWSDCVFLVTGALRDVQVLRVSPDGWGGIGPGSPLELLLVTKDMSTAGGAAFGVDGALYLSDPMGGGIFRYIPGPADWRKASVERVASIDGRPGPVAPALNGSLYVLAEEIDPWEEGTAVLWELPFDDDSSPQPPRRVARLAGEARSLAFDPATGSLYALLRERLGDMVLLELSRPWLRGPRQRPHEVFRLSRWRKELETTMPKLDDVRIPWGLFPRSLDFVSFDPTGYLYFGAPDLVMKGELPRPGAVAFHSVGLSGVVAQGAGEKTARLQAWRKTPGGL